MRTNKYTLLFVAVLMFFFVLNAVAGYYSYSTKDYFEYERGVVGRELIIEADNYFSELSCDDYQSKYNSLSDEYIALGKYLRARKRLSDGKEKYQHFSEFTESEAREVASRYNMTEAQVQRRMRYIEYCRCQLDYAMGFSDYIRGVRENAEQMNSIGIFENDAKKNIIRTAADFYGLENIEIRAASDEGVKMLYSDTMTDVFVCAAAVFCAIVFSVRCRTGIRENAVRKTRFGIFSVFFAVAAAAVYVMNIINANAVLPLGDMKRAVQSVKIFQLCPYLITVGDLSLIRILFKTAACMTVFFIFTAFFSSGKKYLIFFSSALVTAEELIRHFAGSGPDIFTLFRAENVFGTYSTVNAAGYQIKAVWLFILLAAAVFVVSLWISVKSIETSVFEASELAEQSYFEEINKRYNESRMIRHDIKNHLSVIAVLLDSGDSEGARKYIGEISDEIDSIRPPVRTGSNVLDALLFRKFSGAAEKSININTEFMSDFADCRFSDYDLCGIFSNILDNACEACGKLNENERNISLKVKDQMDMVCIFCENRYSEINFSPAGLITLKPDKIAHGLGLKRVSRIAEKYGGTVDIKTDNNIFTISVLLMR